MLKFNSIVSMFFIGVIVLLLSSCHDDNKNKKKHIDPTIIAEPLLEFNQQMVSVEDKQIDDFLNRRSWKMTRCKSGLRYMIYKNGVGMTPKEGETVICDYSIQLIRGEEVYNSKRDGQKIFRVDQSDEITGLHELVKYLKVGDQVKAVIPSYLAYGLIGDEKRIPRKASLVFDIKLKEIR